MSKRFENAHLHNHKKAEHKQRDLTNTTLATIATNTANIKLSADSVNLNVDGVEGLLAGGLPSALTGSGNLKVCLQELGNEGSERLNVDVGSTNTKLPSALTGAGNLKVSIQESFGGHVATESKQDALIAANHTDLVHLSTDLDTLEASLTAMEGKQDSLIGANHTDLVHLSTDLDTVNQKLDTLETSANAIQSAVEGTLTVGSHAVTNAGTFAVQAACSGTVTANLSATDNAVLDAILAKNTEIETSANAIQSAVEGTLTVGSHAVTNAGTFAVQAACSGTVTANLSATDNAVLDAILAKNTEIDSVLDTIKVDTEAIETAVEKLSGVSEAVWINNATINAQALGASLDTTGYTKIRLYGLVNQSFVSGASDLVIMGSLTSGGTYFHLGQAVSQEIGTSADTFGITFNCVIESPPKFIKIWNISGSDNYTMTINAKMTHT